MNGIETLGFTENFCDECDSVVNAAFDVERFWRYEVGRVRCPTCGAIVSPCNECFGTDIKDSVGCDECPWGASAISDAQTSIDMCHRLMPV